MQHMARLRYCDLDLPSRRFPWVRCFEDLAQLFERLALSLHEEEVDCHKLNADPDNVHEVQLPSDLLDADADTVGVHDHSDVEEKEVKSRALQISMVSSCLTGGIRYCVLTFALVLFSRHSTAYKV
jgi:hypothetical protein